MAQARATLVRSLDAATQHAWHQHSAEQIAEALGVDFDQGLSPALAAERLEQFGYNRIPGGATRPIARIVLGQFSDFMVIVLIVAAAVAGLIGEARDAIAILVIVALNAVIGAAQEYRAERAIEALKRMVAHEARVRRGAEEQTVAAEEIVPGDVVLLAAGDVVPADLRLLEVHQLKTNEAALTGESEPVDKSIGALATAELPLGERTNMAYKGTEVTNGRAVGTVVSTASATELGRIAELLRDADTVRTPLQKRLTVFGRRLAIGVLVICAIIFVTGWLRGEPLMLMFLTSISLAVAAIPEALPAVVSVSLALGAYRMSGQQALIRRLPAVETLGSVTYICSDKTGTLTENSMRVETIVTGDKRFQSLAQAASEAMTWEMLGRAMALANDVEAGTDGSPRGEPTEVALYQAAAEAGFDKRALEGELPRLAEIPFDAERKRMTTVHRRGHELVAFTKGAPEYLLPICHTVLTTTGEQPCDTQALLGQAERLSNDGYRVLAFATRTLDALPQAPDADALERELTFLGLVALMDPPREQVPSAVSQCASAGMVPVMITGDHPGTARAIAERVGLAQDGDVALTGAELLELSAQQFEALAPQVSIYARVTPEQKITIVKALQNRGEFVAMTGDGVNDAPALKNADIGVAMGRKGTDVSREAADMVLLDDNFATIVAAVREGRRIYDNIRKFIKYTMTSNSGEIWTLFLAPFLGLPIPLLPLQILWINLVTDGLPGLALAVEPEERGIMQRPPRPPAESIFAHGLWQHMIWVGLLIGALSLSAEAVAYHSGAAEWQTMVFTVLVFSQLAHVLAIRAETDSLITIGIFSNPLLVAAVAVTVALQLAVIYTPWLQPIFKTHALSLPQLGACFALAIVVLVAVEIEKWLVRRGWIYQSHPAS